jgi:hypothetical protein
MSQKFVLGYFDDEETLMHAIEKINATGTKIYEVYSPFPIHGIDDLLGYKRTRLSVAAFIFGCIGFSLALFMQTFMLGLDKWRINIGGKPYLAWPDFVPVTFEGTVLITALGMVFTFMWVNEFFPGAVEKQPHPRVTEDLFVVAIKSEDAEGSDVQSIMSSNGALEVKEEEVLL